MRDRAEKAVHTGIERERCIEALCVLVLIMHIHSYNECANVTQINEQHQYHAWLTDKDRKDLRAAFSFYAYIASTYTVLYDNI